MTGIASAKTIDIHAHAVLRETMGIAGKFGPELGDQDTEKPWFRVGTYVLNGVRYEGSPFMEVDLRLERMNKAGIDFQCLSPNPLTYFHYIPSREAVDFCKTHNDVLAALASSHADRLGAFAALPMQDIPAALEELDRAVNELGMLAPYISTDFPTELDDPALDPFFEKLVALDVPLFLHPAPDGIDGPDGNPKFKRFDLDLLFGFASQETLAVALLIFGGVLERHPKLDICISHGGGTIAFVAGRMAQATRKRAWSRDSLRQDGAFEEQLSRFWFDTHVHDPKSLALLKDIVGDQRFLFGTNFAGWDQPDGDEIAEVPKAFADNARRLLRVA